MSGAEVVLPHGTTFVAVTKIPALLALAKYPVPANGKTLHSICKMPIFVEPEKQQLTDSVPVEPAVEPFTESDHVKLAAIWSALPPFKLGLDEAGWSPYSDACAAAEPFPGWTIYPVWKDAGHVVAIVRRMAAEQYEAALPKDIEDGKLVAVDGLTGRSTTDLRGAIVMLPSLKTYAEKFGVTVRIDADPASEGVDQGEQARSMITGASHNLLDAGIDPPERVDTCHNLLVERAPPLTSTEIAFAFDDIHHLSEAQWKKKLSDLNNCAWLLPAIVVRGKAPKSSTWNPVRFAELLQEKGVTAETLNRRFFSAPTLKPWLASWQESTRALNDFGR